MRAQKQVFHTFDALRGVAAIAVVMFHSPDLYPQGWARNAYLAVDLFFMMSGVVVFKAYGSRLAAGMSLAEFMRIRFVRLMPLYLLGLIIAAVGTALSLLGNNREGWSWAGLAANIGLTLFLLPGPPARFSDVPPSLFPLNPPAWSLLFEVLVNLAFAALLPFTTRVRLILVCGLCA